MCVRVYVCMYKCMFVGLADVRDRFRLKAKVPRTDVCACLCVYVYIHESAYLTSQRGGKDQKEKERGFLWSSIHVYLYMCISSLVGHAYRRLVYIWMCVISV
jgi:hypothetical protein